MIFHWKQGIIKIMKRVKYPRTLHLPYSLGRTNDDKVLKDTTIFEGRRVVVTEKLDGENSSLYQDYLHARSIDSKHHPSRAWLKNFHATICYNIADDEIVNGENVFAQHSIIYNDLETYFYGFSIWKEDTCLSWEDTLKRFSEIGIVSVPVLYEGVYDEEEIKSLFDESKNMEGYVVRLSASFKREDFTKAVAKFVRENHVQTDEHWMHKPVIPNKLK